MPTYAKLKLKNSNSLQELYLYLLQQKSKLLNSEDVKKRLQAGDKEIDMKQNFDKLRGVADYNFSEPGKVKKALINAFEKLNLIDENFKTHIIFVKGNNSNYAYVPVIKFELRLITEEERKRTRIDILETAVIDKLIMLYRERHKLTGLFSEEDEKKFKNWYGNKKKDFSDKTRIFAEVYSSMFPYAITEEHPFAIKFAEEGLLTISY